ncbi:MAG: YkgJ family cysteine cluster protein [Deltaproteobacteria bacterium]|nr:YkgJ family cysteine cluster protein [Deltaproteobacteria bacterium]
MIEDTNESLAVETEVTQEQSKPTAPPPAQLSSDDFASYLEYRNKLDTIAKEIAGKYKTQIECRGGCSHCCGKTALCMPIEYAYLRWCYQQGRLQAPQTYAQGSCPLLSGNQCSILPERPLVCRVQGLPHWVRVGYSKGYRVTCPQNFKPAPSLESIPMEDFVDLEALNISLSRLNLTFCEQHGIKDASRKIPVQMIFDEEDALHPAPPQPPSDIKA